jgi:NTE family protein
MLKRTCTYLIITLLSLFARLNAQTVGLVLSGGGAKGMAHIGVIRALEENNIPIDYIAGTSMGAVIGSLYCMGYSADEMEDLIRSDEFRNWYMGSKDMSYDFYFKQNPPTPALVSAQIAIRDSMTVIRPMVNSVVDPLQMNLAFVDVFAGASAVCDKNFDNLFVPFRAVASDVFNKNSIVLSKGDLGDAVRASMSFPFVFRPIKIDSIIAYDGGIYDNFPVDVMVNDFHPDFIIGSVVAIAPGEPELEIPDEFDLMGQVRSMIVQKSDYSLDPDLGVKVEFDLRSVGLLDFHKIDEVSDLGYHNTMLLMDSIKSRTAARRDVASVREARYAFKSRVPDLIFRDVDVTGVNQAQKRYIKKELNAADGIFDFEDFKSGYFKLLSEEAINEIIPGTTFSESDSTFGLNLNVSLDKYPTFSLGGGLSTTISSQLYGSVEYNHIGEASESYLLEGQIGRAYNNAQLFTRIDVPARIPMSMSIQFAFNNMNYFRSGFISSDKYMPALNKCVEFYGKIKLSRPFLNSYKAVFSFGLGHHKDYYSQSSSVDLRTFRYDCSRHNILGGSVSFTGNTLNSLQYPTSGRSETIRAFIGTENDLFRPQDKYSSEHHSVDRSWLQIEAYSEHYIKLSPHVTLGTLFNAYYSSRNFSSNYQATIMQAGCFKPTVNSKFLFDPDFSANAFVAVGIKPIWIINSIFHLRAELYAFQPTRPIVNEDGLARYGKVLGGFQMMGELNFVAQYQRISFNAFVDLSTSSYNPSLVGVTLGFLMPNEWFME